MNCGEDPARGLWTEEYLIEIAFSSKSQKMGGGESLQTLHFLILWVLPCEAEWFEGGGVRERYSCGCVQKGDPGPDSDSTGFLGSMAKQGEGSKVYYGLLKCKGVFGG